MRAMIEGCRSLLACRLRFVCAFCKPKILWGDRGREQVQSHTLEIGSVRYEASSMRKKRTGSILEQELCHFAINSSSLLSVHHRPSVVRQSINFITRVGADEEIAVA